MYFDGGFVIWFISVIDTTDCYRSLYLYARFSSGVEKIFILSALRVDLPTSLSSNIYENAFYGRKGSCLILSFVDNFISLHFTIGTPCIIFVHWNNIRYFIISPFECNYLPPVLHILNDYFDSTSITIIRFHFFKRQNLSLYQRIRR